jgi:hypothetical protein
VIGMIYFGRVKNGVIVLADSARLPEGAEVRIDLVPPAPVESNGAIPALYDRLKPFIGSVTDLPSDASVNHDHYLYGSPKQP